MGIKYADEKLHSEIKASPYSNGNQAANQLTVYVKFVYGV